MKVRNLVVFAIMTSFLLLTGCITVVDDNKEDMVYVSKEELAELNKTIEQLEKETGKEGVEETVVEPVEEIGLANPASKYCVENGGELEIRKDEEGADVGICKLDAGVECEEWSYVKGECPDEVTDKPAEEVVDEPVEEVVDEPVDEPKEELASNAIVKEYVAGELIEIKPKAKDADNDEITFSFTAPLDAAGTWQTSEGDEGEYVVTITASDGMSESSMNVKLVVYAANHAPIMNRIDDVILTAGETIKLSPVVTDEDNDPIKISYSGFMSESEYETTKEDVGEYEVTVTASDGILEVSQDVQVTVLKMNTPPTLDVKKMFDLVEGEYLSVDAEFSDVDSEDTLKVTYSAPLEEDGTWQTSLGDAGTYTATVRVTDGKATAKKSIVIKVAKANSAPVITLEGVTVVVNVGEKEVVKLSPVIEDADGDALEITYSGWMTTNTVTVTDADEGDHKVIVLVSDGKEESSAEATVTVEVNHPPTFEI